MSGEPTVSVVIPALSAAATIGQAVASIAHQDYRGPIEVVVADGDIDGSSGDAARQAMKGVVVIPNPSTNTADAL